MTKLSKRTYRTAVKNVMREMVRECYRRFPDFGKNAAIDSTDVRAWVNWTKKPPSDPDATWSVKSTVGNIKRFWLGYKAHLMVDTDYELPIALNVTTANVADLRGGTAILANARSTYSRFRPKYIMGNAGYSSKKFREVITKHYHSQPIIKASKHHKKALKLQRVDFDLIYNRRTVVERCFSRLKEHRSLNYVRVQRIQKVTVHCFLSVIILQAQALATNSRVSVRRVA